MRPGEYKSFKDMGMSGMRFMSMKRIMDSLTRLMLMNLMPLMPMSLKLLYSPGLMYIILPLYWGCSYISQWPSITLQDWQSFML
ncbi:Gamma-crystallin M1 [Liparis tanakae]|uniref:Gamma-crystallin M1 n=1 Tax=Liparis tanakae TaxID=230148 RepID=A0A4Z2F8S1_9TELE|nr:Gamma-crystallin M1 [Liparis tanakae]